MAFSEVQSQGGPIQVEPVRLAEQMVQVTWNAQHRVPWHWPVPAYLLTKAIAAGLWLWLALEILLPQLSGLGPQDHRDHLIVWAGGMSLLFTAITTGLLVWDLERPERFLSILTRPQWRSWLTRGAFILVAFSGLSMLLWVQSFSPSVGALFGMNGPGALFVQSGLTVAIVPLAVGTAVYTAFLFAQAEGRDLWQSPLLPLHLLIQTLTMGAGALVALGALLPHVLSHPPLVPFGVLLALDALVTLTGEFGVPHASDTAAEAAHQIRSGRWRHHFWWGGMVLGHALPLVLLWLSWSNPGAGIAALDVAAFLAAAIGMFLYEVAFVMAPQQVPNS
jgi:formate-dependent nitrite reductase membrane component NrfD